ncbi:MAG: hypothetical protein HPY85_01230 [Anaerolineae bacterium]|jgi:hypothetical protein|nr:hypothetical protein [Anaerolineae bacterium]
MGKSVRTITDAYHLEGQILSNFRRGLRRQDQAVLDELLSYTHKHLAAASLASDALPMEMFLLAMILEQQKEIEALRVRLQRLEQSAAG